MQPTLVICDSISDGKLPQIQSTPSHKQLFTTTWLLSKGKQVAQPWQRDRASSIDDFKCSLQIACNTGMLCLIKIELSYWLAGT